MSYKALGEKIKQIDFTSAFIIFLCKNTFSMSTIIYLINMYGILVALSKIQSYTNN